MNAIATLYDFIERAKKERKYADNTIGGFKAALKLFEVDLNDDEKNSLDTLQNNLPTIANDVYAKNKDKFSSGTIMVYRSRISGLIKDFKRYGDSPSKMASWNPRRMSSSLKSKPVSGASVRTRESDITEGQIIDMTPARIMSPASLQAQGGVTAFDASGRFNELNRSEVYLREGLKVTLELPIDLTQKEADKLKSYIDLMVAD